MNSIVVSKRVLLICFDSCLGTCSKMSRWTGMSACSLSTTVNEMISRFFLFRRFYQFASTLFADPKLGSWGDKDFCMFLSSTAHKKIMISIFFFAFWEGFYQFAPPPNTNSFKIRYQRERGSRYVLFLLLYIKIMISIIVFFYYSWSSNVYEK